MKQEDKEMLFEELSERLPYGVYCKIDDCSEPVKLAGIKTHDELLYLFGNVWVDPDTNNVRPYLRSFPSAATAKERRELVGIINEKYFSKKCGIIRSRGEDYIAIAKDNTFIQISKKFLKYLCSNHFDVNGLIPKGLALEAPEGIYPINN